MKPNNKILKTYFGGKNGSGVYQQIINQIPPHDVYIEPFAGSGAIVQYKKAATVGTYINDIDPLIFEKWIGSGIDVPNCVISNSCAIEFLRKFYFSPFLRYVVYLDPPYPLSSRRSDRKVYNNEMTDDQHIELLKVITDLPAFVNILISTYENQIYSEMLEGWSLHTFTAQTRQGPATELLYMNYRNAGILHQYDYLGNDYIDRQRIKRKIERETKKLLNLPAHERNAIIQAVLQL